MNPVEGRMADSDGDVVEPGPPADSLLAMHDPADADADVDFDPYTLPALTKEELDAL